MLTWPKRSTDALLLIRLTTQAWERLGILCQNSQTIPKLLFFLFKITFSVYEKILTLAFCKLFTFSGCGCFCGFFSYLLFFSRFCWTISSLSFLSFLADISLFLSWVLTGMYCFPFHPHTSEVHRYDMLSKHSFFLLFSPF